MKTPSKPTRSQGAVGRDARVAGPALSTWRHHIYADVDRARPTTTTRRQARRSSREQTIINPCIDNKTNRQQSSVHASTKKRLMKRYLNKRHKTMARTSTLHTPRGRDRIATVPVLRQMKTKNWRMCRRKETAAKKRKRRRGAPAANNRNSGQKRPEFLWKNDAEPENIRKPTRPTENPHPPECARASPPMRDSTP